MYDINTVVLFNLFFRSVDIVGIFFVCFTLLRRGAIYF